MRVMINSSAFTTKGELLARLAIIVASALVFAACSSSTEQAVEVDSSTTTTVEESNFVESTGEPGTEEVDSVEEPVEETADEPEAESAETTIVDEQEPEVESAEQVEEPADDLTGSQVLTDVVADAQGGRAFFDGTVDEVADLEDLVADAWGDGDLGLHRGHAQVENVLEVFLGIDHDGMHDYMDQGLNLAETAEAVEKDPDALIESLTNSYIPFVDEGVENGVIAADEANEWIELLRNEFTDRVFWDGVSAS